MTTRFFETVQDSQNKHHPVVPMPGCPCKRCVVWHDGYCDHTARSLGPLGAKLVLASVGKGKCKPFEPKVMAILEKRANPTP